MTSAELRSISDNATRLIEVRRELQVQRMNKDKEFSVFLDAEDKNMQEKINHPSWKTYRNMLTEYSQLTHNLATCNYYISKHV